MSTTLIEELEEAARLAEAAGRGKMSDGECIAERKIAELQHVSVRFAGRSKPSGIDDYAATEAAENALWRRGSRSVPRITHDH